MTKTDSRENNSSIRELAFSSLKKTLNGLFNKLFLRGLGSVVAAFLIGKNFLKYSEEDSIILGIVILFGFFLIEFIIRLLYGFVLLRNRRQEESIYGDAIILLKDGFAKIHWLRKLDPMPDDEFMETMIFLCDQVKKIFDKKTKAKCSVSIKVGINEGGMTSETEVTNLCRDSNARGRDTKAYIETKHVVFMNTCFNSILTEVKNQNKLLHYINNDITNSNDYFNTSKKCYDDEVLPYESEIVVPIIPIVRGKKDFNLLGFLCVDCDKRKAFDTKYDTHILQGIADGIYDIIVTRSFKKLTITE